MANKPTYEELEKRVKELEKEASKRKRAEKALKESEAQKRAILDGSIDRIRLVDKDLRIIWANETTLKKLNVAAEDLVGQVCYKVFRGRDTPCVGCPAKKAVETGQIEHAVLYRPEAQEVIKGETYVDSYGIPIKKESGDIVNIIQITRNITERKLAEEALRESEEKFRTFMETASDLMHIADKDGNLTYVNESMARTLGYPKEEMTGMHITQVLGNGEVEKHFKSNWEKLVTTGKIDLEAVWKTKYGKEIFGETRVAAIYDSNGGYIGSRGVCRDLSERIQAEEALRESEERYRTLFEDSTDAVYINTREGKLVEVNQSFLDLFCIAREEIPDLNVLQLYVNPDDRPRFQNEIEKKGSVKDFPIRLYKKDRTEMDCLLTSTVWRASDGSIVGYQGIIRDITEIKRAEEALRESEEKYRGLFEYATDAIFIADTNTNIILDANRQAERLIGRPKDEIIGMHQSKLHPPHQAEYYKDRFRGHVQKGRILDLEAEVIKRDGRIVPVFISASVISLHGKEVIQVLFKDVTEEKVILDLRKEMAVRRLIEKAKGVLMDRHRISEEEAMRRLQKESRRQSKKIEEIAQGVVSSGLILNRNPFSLVFRILL
jgi:PAS domain S-box-containing protein